MQEMEWIGWKPQPDPLVFLPNGMTYDVEMIRIQNMQTFLKLRREGRDKYIRTLIRQVDEWRYDEPGHTEYADVIRCLYHTGILTDVYSVPCEKPYYERRIYRTYLLPSVTIEGSMMFLADDWARLFLDKLDLLPNTNRGT
jgi:hypothetical protein